MTSFSFELPAHNHSHHAFDPDRYVLNEDLAAAVRVAIALGQPLLLTGEPGTGKTRLAHKIAHELSKQHPEFTPEPLVFNAKATSVAQDLFYTYDAMRHFHDANLQKTAGKEAPPTSDYVELRALGEAIARSNEGEVADGRFVKEKNTRSSVVLIDEIDKAPRDFPNDILNEIERFSFEIKEANNHQIVKGDGQRIVLFMTSNSEKNLPEPFLRRCVFFHIPFPDKAQLIQIIESQLGNGTDYSDERLVDHFNRIRNLVRKKKPATAELIAWLRILELHHFLDGPLDFRSLNGEQKKILRHSYSVLAKNKEDLKEIEEDLRGRG